MVKKPNERVLGDAQPNSAKLGATGFKKKPRKIAGGRGLKAALAVNNNGHRSIHGPRGWRATLCSGGVQRPSCRQRAAAGARWKGRAPPPASETRAARPWQKPTGIKGPINLQLLCKGGRGRRETRSCLNRIEPPHRRQLGPGLPRGIAASRKKRNPEPSPPPGCGSRAGGSAGAAVAERVCICAHER